MSRNLKDCVDQLRKVVPYEIGVYEGALELGEHTPQTKQWKAVVESIACHERAMADYRKMPLKRKVFTFNSDEFTYLHTQDNYEVAAYRGEIVMVNTASTDAGTAVKVGKLETIPLPEMRNVLYEVSPSVFREVQINKLLTSMNFGRELRGQGPRPPVALWRIPNAS